MLIGILTGATASGKSALALRLAEELGCEIVSADSRQIYRGFRVGTGQPSREERERVVHRFVDCVPPEENFSAGEFAREVVRLEKEDPGTPRLVAGGTGFYVAALVRGLPPLPSADMKIRNALRDELRERGARALRDELERVDPETAARLPESDVRRVARALEVFRATGRPFSWWKDRAEAPFPETPLAVLERDPAENRALIEARVRGMFRAGWADEARGLLESGVPEDAPAFGSLGYPQALRVARGEMGEEEAIAEVTLRTAQYAKRQRTFFRGQLPGARRCPAGDGALEFLRGLFRPVPGRKSGKSAPENANFADSP